MRPIRSLLYVPAHKQDWVENALGRYDSDGFVFDLEDSVPRDEKEAARETLRATVGEFEETKKLVTSRVNPPESGDLEADLHAIVRPGLDVVVVPKLAEPEQVSYVANVLEYLERRRGISNRIQLCLLPETAAGIRNVYDLCQVTDRVAAVVGGAPEKGDINRAIGYDWSKEGKESLHLRSKVLLDTKAAGVEQVLAGSYLGVDDVDGVVESAQEARQLGYTGQHVIHPTHIEPVNDVFSPDPDEIAYCEDLLEAMDEAETEGTAAIRFRGEMVDIAHVQYAKDLLNRAEWFDLVD